MPAEKRLHGGSGHARSWKPHANGCPMCALVGPYSNATPSGGAVRSGSPVVSTGAATGRHAGKSRGREAAGSKVASASTIGLRICHLWRLTPELSRTAKRFRLERIVRPHGWHATATVWTVPASADTCSQQLIPAGWYSMKVPDSLWTGSEGPYRRLTCEAGIPGHRPRGVQASGPMPRSARTRCCTPAAFCSSQPTVTTRPEYCSSVPSPVSTRCNGSPKMRRALASVAPDTTPPMLSSEAGISPAQAGADRISTTRARVFRMRPNT
jgi:hypothetical protein